MEVNNKILKKSGYLYTYYYALVKLTIIAAYVRLERTINVYALVYLGD